MRITKTVKTESGDVAVIELTVAEIRAWLKSIESGENKFDLIGESLLGAVSFRELEIMTDIDDFDVLTQSELAAISKAAKEVNPLFFDLIARLRKALAE